MSYLTLTNFVTYFTEVLTMILNGIGIIFLVVTITSITVIELMKAYNPNISTTKEAIDHIITNLKESEEKPVPLDDAVFEYMGQMFKDTRLDLMIVPMIGLMTVMIIGDYLFPHLMVGWLETAMTYYISVVPYITYFVMLYMLGIMTITAARVIGGKTVELISVIADKIKETEKENEPQ